MNATVGRMVGLALVLGVQASSALAAGIPWQPNWTSARAEASRTHKAVMVDFYTDW